MSKEKFACPVCGYLTLLEQYDEICEVCFWQSDHVDNNPDPANKTLGPNHVNLYQAKINFAKFGAAEERNIKNVRPPREKEKK